jgi:hypothetical protein
MTYDAKVTLKFDSTWTPNYHVGSHDDFLPEEHYEFVVPAADLTAKQYFKLFEKFMLCVGMCPSSIRSGAMSLVFNEWTSEEEQRKVCKEYELTMDEDLEDKFQEYKIREEEIARLQKITEETIAKHYPQSEPKIKGDWEYTDEEVKQMNMENGQ